MIELLNDFPDNIVACACRGQVVRRDYETVLVPAVESALEQHRKIRLYYEIGEDFKGIDAGAVWEDFKIGVEHLSHWERIAIVTDVRWVDHTFKAFSFVIPGDVRIFPLADVQAAREWVVASR